MANTSKLHNARAVYQNSTMIEAKKIDETKDLPMATNLPTLLNSTNIQATCCPAPSCNAFLTPAAPETSLPIPNSNPYQPKTRIRIVMAILSHHQRREGSTTNQLIASTATKSTMTTNQLIAPTATITSEKVKEFLSHIQEPRGTVQAQRQEIATSRRERQDLISQIMR